MANPEHVERLKQGVGAWNEWRKTNPSVRPNLEQADLSGTSFVGVDLNDANLIGTDLGAVDLTGADLRAAYLMEADLYVADLTNADLRGANLTKANLKGADLSGVNLWAATLSESDLSGANLSEANLRGTDLTRAILVDTNFEKSNLSGSSIFGISAWNVNLTGANQTNLIITRDDEPEITVDNLQVAQFIYLLLNNAEIRNVIDTITSKAVLILGRFTEERKVVLDALRDELRKRGYLPILFDFDKPDSRDLTETISTLAHMARFIIADITDAKSIPQELQAIVPNLPSVAVQPVIARDAYEYAMFEHFKRYPWVLATYQYDDTAHLLASLADHIIAPAEAKVKELRPGL